MSNDRPCGAGIRPFPNDTEIRCAEPLGHSQQHRGILKDYAYPGSETLITWHENDRRTFHGDWPGACGEAVDEQSPTCVLPLHHHGRCAS